MKSQLLLGRPLRVALSAIATAAILTGSTALAQTSLYWDGGSSNIATTGDGASDGGSGTWNTTILNWDNGNAVPHVAWDNANNDTAVFGGASGTVTIEGGVTVGGLTFSTNNYTLTGDALTFGTTGEIQNGGTATISSVVAGSVPITKIGNGQLNLLAINAFTGDTVINGGTVRVGANNTSATFGPSNYSGDISIASGATLYLTNNQAQNFSGVISGGGTLSKGGSNTLTLSGANTYTGKTVIAGSGAGGPSMSISSFNSVFTDTGLGTVHLPSSSLGAPTTVANGTIQFGNGGNIRNCTLFYTGPGEVTDRVMNVRFNDKSDHSIYANGSGLLKFTSTFVITRSSGGQGASFFLRGSGDGEIAGGTSGGVIPGFLEKRDSGTWTLGGTTTADDLIVSNGTLDIDGTVDSISANGGGGLVTVSGGTLTVDGLLDFETSTTISGGTLDGSGALGIDIDGTTSDLITLSSGTFTAIDLTIAVASAGSGLTEPEYVLLSTTGGTFTGPFAGLTGAPGYELNYDTPNQVKLVSTGGGSAFNTWAASNGVPDDSEAVDSDSGSLNNLGEFGLGGDPTDANDDGSLLHAFSDEVVGGGAEEGILTILVRTGASFTDGAPAVSAAVDGIVYTVSADSSLPVGGSVTVTGTAAVTTGLPAAPAGYEYASFYVTGPEGYFQVTVAPE